MSFFPKSLNGKIIFIFQNPVQISPPSLKNSWLLLCVTDTVRASTLASCLGKDVGKAVLPWVWGQTYLHRSRKPTACIQESLHTGHWGGSWLGNKPHDDRGREIWSTMWYWSLAFVPSLTPWTHVQMFIDCWLRAWILTFSAWIQISVLSLTSCLERVS